MIGAGVEFAVASVHAIAAVVTDATITAEHELIGRQGRLTAWHNDVAVAALTPWVTGFRMTSRLSAPPGSASCPLAATAVAGHLLRRWPEV